MTSHNLRFPLAGDASPRTFTCSVRTRPSNSARYSRRFLFTSFNTRHAAKPACVKVSFLTENCLSEATALAVVAHRKTKKSPLTPHSAGLLRKSLLACGNPEAAASEMLLRGWTAVKPEWLKDDAAQGKPLVARPEPDRTGSIWVPAESAPWRAWQQAKGSGYLAARKKDRPGYPDGGAWLPTEYPDARKSA